MVGRLLFNDHGVLCIVKGKNNCGSDAAAN